MKTEILSKSFEYVLQGKNTTLRKRKRSGKSKARENYARKFQANGDFRYSLKASENECFLMFPKDLEIGFKGVLKNAFS